MRPDRKIEAHLGDVADYLNNEAPIRLPYRTHYDGPRWIETITATVMGFVACFSFVLLVLAFLVMLFLYAPAHATWRAEYAQASPETRDWFRNAELTDAARERLHYRKCCDHADVVKTRFEVDHSTGRDVWRYEDTLGHMKLIPDDVIHWGVSAPGGAPTLFVYAGTETCFFPGDGGI